MLTPANIDEPKHLQLRWSKRVSLTTRILAVNSFALALMVFGLLALDSFRSGLFDERLQTSRVKLDSLAELITDIPAQNRAEYLVRIGDKNDSRLRLYDAKGQKIIDNFAISSPNYILRDPDSEPIEKILARYLDKLFNFLVFEPQLQTFEEPKNDILSSWDGANKVNHNRPYSAIMNAPDLSPVIVTIAQTVDGQYTLIETVNAHDLRIKVRAERSRILIFFFIVLAISILLSLFLARTIVKPIRHLAVSAVKVRLGRSPDVSIPRLPERHDEIGMLARALSDMSITLRSRIDRTQSFADDVAHEIKNPLASLRSALEGLETIKDPILSKQLLDIAKDDVLRMDRLITDIAEAGRIDSQVSRAKFDTIDLLSTLDAVVRNYRQRDQSIDNSVITLVDETDIPPMILGERIRIERVIENLIANSISFAKPEGLIEIFVKSSQGMIIICVCDNGPGIDESDYEKIFQRFYSSRPVTEDFGKHSGLGLAISRTIIEAHNGSIIARKRPDGEKGACFEIQLPLVVSHE